MTMIVKGRCLRSSRKGAEQWQFHWPNRGRAIKIWLHPHECRFLWCFSLGVSEYDLDKPVHLFSSDLWGGNQELTTKINDFGLGLAAKIKLAFEQDAELRAEEME